MTGDGTEYEVPTGGSRVRDMPERLRPREEMDRLGVEHVSDDVLLAILIRSGTSGRNVRDLARDILTQYSSLTSLANASVEELAAIRGMGRVKAQVLRAGLELAKRLSEESVGRGAHVRTARDVCGLLRETVRVLDHEAFWVIILDTKNRAKKEPVEVTRGLLDSSLVHPREIFREAVKSAAGAVPLAHNHPSGDPTPSAEDIRVTRQLVEAGKIMDIRVLDHVVIGKASKSGDREFVSMREEGLAEFG
ncbi:MAG: DNA repair protein RadC [Lentisphaerae bacterium]|nr:DNA repair protein RadC [Lentisphaerota bacterium]